MVRPTSFLSSKSTGNLSVALFNPIPGNFFNNTPTDVDYRSITIRATFFTQNRFSITE